ncbi:hypothetical protein EK21DRAFT_99654 [Setomelanomma holmii]|uniref:Pre-mRNA polyadenylation factor Fip1 domain-containing protein n=1 Tax=Setomelanomma holmii TaxID=210430 RepID=A0A9P4LP89_9PLEO|nr:hypothetical protein EK21DRAFT_99654 [Setomelanomma holmii]
MASDHEDEDDDLYGTSETKTEQQDGVKNEDGESSGDEPMDEGADSGDDDDDDSESVSPPTTQHPAESKAIKIEAPPQTSTPSQTSQQPPPKPLAQGGTVPQLSSTPGTAFPALRTSTIDVNGNPVYPPQGKPILQVDLDADLAEEQKIWRRPGEDQSDYFNYGFDEFNWEMYRQKQMNMASTLQAQKNDLAQMQAMIGGGGMPGMPGPGPPAQNQPPTGPGGGGAGVGVGNEAQQMEMMFQQMVSQGMDPSQMDFGSFMQMAGQGMPGFPGPGGPGGQQGGFQQGNQGGGRGGRGGRGRGW